MNPDYTTAPARQRGTGGGGVKNGYLSQRIQLSLRAHFRSRTFPRALDMPPRAKPHLRSCRANVDQADNELTKKAACDHCLSIWDLGERSRTCRANIDRCAYLGKSIADRVQLAEHRLGVSLALPPKRARTHSTRSANPTLLEREPPSESAITLR